MSTLTTEELRRYSRHLALREFGVENQLKLKEAKVIVVGAGGLGCPVLLYLTAAGIGTICIADFDTLDISNLQRQVLYTTEDTGEKKAKAAADRLKQLNPLISFCVYPLKLT